VHVTQSDNLSRFPIIRWNGTHFGVIYFENLRLPNGDSATSTNFALLDSAGNVLRSGVRLYNANLGFLSSNAEIPFVWDGTGWGVFTIDSAGNAPPDLWYRRLLPNGDNNGAPVRITNTPNDIDGDVAVAWSGSEYGIAWIEFRDTTSKLRFLRMQANGTFVGSTQLIEQNGAGETLFSPTLTWNGGEWALAWNAANATEDVVRFKTLNPDGSPKTATVRLSDDTITDPIDDEVPVVKAKPGGGYIVFTASFGGQQFDVARLTADASGNRSGSRVFLTSTIDAIGTNVLRVATDGTRFLVGYDSIDIGDTDAATLITDGAGNLTSGPFVITPAHNSSTSLNPVIVAMNASFGALWAEQIFFNPTQIYGKFFDGGGNVTQTRFPLFVSNNLATRFAAVGTPSSFGLSWRDQNNNLRFGRFDVNGNSLMADVVVSPNGANPGLGWNGEQFGLAFFEGNELRFQRMNTNGTTSGPKIFVGTGNGNPASPLVRWVDRGWAIVWRSGSSLFFALLDRNGAYVVAPIQVTFTGNPANNPQIAWSGDVLGVVWRENRLINPPGDDIYFTALGLDGTKQFAE